MVEITPSHVARVGSLTVRRALPRRARRTVGPWCFADHMGPAVVTEEAGVEIGPHPHIGLQTATWLVAGEILHRDSLGSEQVIRPGQLNLMTAGHGVSHSEESTGRHRGSLHGMQLWIAQPEATRHGSAAFEHHGDLPAVELDHATVTVIIGDLGDLGDLGHVSSPARRDTDHVGLELSLRPGESVVPMRREREHALVVMDGAITVGSSVVEAGALAYLGLGRDELAVSADGPATALLIGGVPWDEELIMWWNFVARTRDEISAAYGDWAAASERFGTVDSRLDRIPTSPPPWAPSSAD